MLYAEVAINTVVEQTYHYHIPEKLEHRLLKGHLVRVSFGTAMQPGIVVDIHDALPPDIADIQTKPILALLDPDPVMTVMHIELGFWLAKRYLAPVGQCLWLMLPPGITGSSSVEITLLDHEADPGGSVQAQIVSLLREHGDMSRKQLEKLMKRKRISSALSALEESGVIEQDAVLAPPTARPKTVRTARLLIMPDQIAAGQRVSSGQWRIINLLARFPYPLDASLIYEVTGASSSTLKALEDRGFVARGERIAYRDSLADRDFIPTERLELTQEQVRVWDVVRDALNEARKPILTRHQIKSAISPGTAKAVRQKGTAFLLHGVTGSGKTEIYLHAIEHVLAQARQAIFLVPEIALTPQTIQRVAARFPDQVAVVHGSLSTGERYDTWRRARNGEINVVVGTRSALFTPLPDIGLIILDEEHDPSYKHAPPFNPPYYDARAVAERIVQLNDATLILGSATPAMETFYRAQHNEIGYLHLPSRIMGHRNRVQLQAERIGQVTRYKAAEGSAMTIDLPPVQVVDMREELKGGNRGMFSRALQEGLQTVVENGQQAILLLNRRGTASYVFCRDCGYTVECSRCDAPMTYHQADELLHCHRCGYQTMPPTRCPNCGSDRIRYFGAGTQQVEAELSRTFPDIRVIRWDADTAMQPDMHEEILARFVQQEADVMVGTQMIAKGLDLPLVTLVGVVSADPGLALPDFRADERAFQLLTQVAGRAGRGILGGKVIIQTYQPQHPSIAYAAQHDYTGFYAHELLNRRELGYPPFRRMARILVQSTHPVNVQREAERIADELNHRIAKLDLSDTTIIGPAPCFYTRIDKHYRWHILIRSQDPTVLLRGLRLREGIYVDMDVQDVL
ncbi:primosomal protein N' [Phototrophicus methaneseepsis]|uniref:Replication restart protein PriA n=1 Tax=Phototrophicus methaneseepsis TaxID=2710758 RepID=A0A7S8ECZ5_9CHLR|nr:primosomal protein N' [Phototrophicus methaneseepsis]QPC84458.1 primosomal protein N' [Phototrophicus methaneseepsis]